MENHNGHSYAAFKRKAKNIKSYLEKKNLV